MVVIFRILLYRASTSVDETLWPWARYLLSPLLALIGHAAVALLFRAYRPARTTLSYVDMLGVAATGAVFVLLPMVFFPKVAIVLHAAVIGASYTVIRRLGGREKEVTTPIRPRSIVGLDPDAPEPTGWRLSPVQRVFFQSTSLRPRIALGLTLLTAYTISTALSGFNGSQTIVIVMIFTVSFVPMMANLLEATDALPIPRSQVLPWLTVAFLALTLLTSTMSSVFESDKPYGETAPTTSVHFDWSRKWDRPVLLVPARLWSWSASPEGRTARAPWGETWEAEPVKFLGCATPLHSPYGVGADNTVRFARWQATRALKAAGARDFIIENHLLPACDPERILGKIPSYKFHDGPFPIPRSPWHKRSFGLRTILSVLIWGILTRVALRSRNPRRGVTRWSQLRLAINVGIFAWFVMLVPLLLNPPSWSLSSYQVVEAWADRQLGGSPLAWLALTVVLVAALYSWILQGFRRTETPPLATPNWGQSVAPIY